MWGLHGIVASRAGAGSEFFSQIDNLVWEREFHKGERNFPWGPPRAGGESKERGQGARGQSFILRIGEAHGGPRSLVAATPTTPPRRRTRRSASLHGKTNGGPCSVMAAIHVPTTRNLLDEITGAEHVSIKTPGCMPAKWRTRRSASLHGKTRAPAQGSVLHFTDSTTCIGRFLVR